MHEYLHRIRTFPLIFILLLACVLIPTEGSAGVGIKRAMILHSYYQGSTWTDRFHQGMVDGLASDTLKVVYNTEYLDSKRYPDPRTRKLFLDLLRHKVQKERLDLVLVSDNNALDLALSHRSTLFPDVPIVFAGINEYSPELIAGHTGITGVTEKPALAETLATALKLHPQTREVVLITDTLTATGRILRADISKDLPTLPDNVQYTFWDNLTLDETRTRLSELDSGQLILWIGMLRDEKGLIPGVVEQIHFLNRHSPVPIYSCWSHTIGEGYVGGKIVSSYHQGKLAGQMALRVLGGEDANQIPVAPVEAANVFMFDFREMKRFGIKAASLPPESIILNKPESFYQSHKTFVWSAGTIILLLSGLVTLMIFNIIRRQKAEESLRRAHHELERRVEERTAELARTNSQLHGEIEVRKRTEEELRKSNRELDAFVYTVSHDLRTPLSTIIGSIDFLLEDQRHQLTGVALELLSNIDSEGKKMLAMMEDLLTLSIVGQLERPGKAVDLGEVAGEAIATLRKRLSAAGVTVRAEALPRMHVPKTLLALIFNNLIGNALAYGSRPGDVIEMGGEREGERVRLYVRDQGPGISENERDSIFEVFYRGSTGKGLSGTGVGLATVSKIANLYRGRAWVEDTPGGGSTFWVEMKDTSTSAK